MPIYKKVNKNFFKKWTSEMAYVLGFFAADGYITVNNRGGQFWCIQITDKNLLEDIRDIINSEHTIGIRYRIKSTEKTQYRLQIGSIEMCNDLRRLGCGERKTNNITVPNVPKQYFPDFVRGYFDGDGNVWVGKTHKNKVSATIGIMTMLTSCSYEFLHELKKGLGDFEIRGGSIYQSKKNYTRLQFSIRDSLKLYDFMYNRRVLKNTLFLKRKKVVFEKFKRLRL